ncbi:MAG TPA: SMC-Scp complex subunit ScpB [Nitrososphaeraceae archaeon]|nr:SMC-Scp complex subunit ScpB [Nitrososphaeraceae archaeon]
MFSYDEISARIEAALYSAGRPLTVDELVKASGTNSRDKSLKIISDLMKKTRTIFKALEIDQLEDGTFVFQVRPQYAPIIRKFANRPVVSGGALKTLSYITYEQPIASRRLVQIRGSQVYSHLKELERIGFIKYEKVGRLKIFRTSKKFQDYFGIEDVDTLKGKLLDTKSDYNKSLQKH